MKVENVTIASIKQYKKNNKLHPEKQVEKIARSIQEFGFNTPILLDKDSFIVAGHGRYLAAIKLGMSEIPCIRIENLSKNQVRAYRIADNKTAETEWNYKALEDEFKLLLKSDFDETLTAFDNDEINKLLEENLNQGKNVEEVDHIGKLTITCPKCNHKFNKKEGK